MQLEITPELRKKWKKINQTRKEQNKTALNFPLFMKVRNRIDETPESYYQGSWCAKDEKAPCGTAACIAGEAVICSRKTVKAGLKFLWDIEASIHVSIALTAEELLGIDHNENALFTGNGSNWLPKYSDLYYRAKTRKSRARVAVRYLDHIIKTGEIVEEENFVQEVY